MTEDRLALFQTDHFTAERLSLPDLDLVSNLNRECADFFKLQNGMSATDADDREFFAPAPPRCGDATKLPIGIFDARKQLVGILDILCGYRLTTDWYLGLMLLSPSYQGQGLGTEIHSGFVGYARRTGAQRILLAVLEANTAARRFWLRLGYRKVKDFPPRQFGIRMHAVTEFELMIAEAPRK